MSTLPRHYRRPAKPYMRPAKPSRGDPKECMEGARKVVVDNFTLDKPYDQLSEEQHLESKGPNNVLENVSVDGLPSRNE